ncbi:hypothetical protein KKA08_00995, partial [bacterium]|nr:hypothetical protein [bacterium]
MKKNLVITVFITICCLILSCTDSDSPNGSGNQEPPATLWTQYYGSPQSGYGEEVLQTDDGVFLLLGSNQISEGYETWLLKTDQNGDSLWKHTFDLGSSAHGFSIQPTLDDGYVITGQYDLYGNWSDIFLLKTDGFGNELWHQVYAEGDSAGTQGTDILVTPDGGYLIAATYHYSPYN